MTRAASAATRAVRPGSLGAWWLAFRPRTLTASATPVIVGSAVAYYEGGFRLLPALAALLGALLLQLASNLANDVLDFERGADTPERLSSWEVPIKAVVTLARGSSPVRAWWSRARATSFVPAPSRASI